MAYNFAKRLKTLRGLTPYEHICKVWTMQPNRFRLDPLHHTVGLNTLQMIDATIIRAHHCAAGGKGGPSATRSVVRAAASRPK